MARQAEKESSKLLDIEQRISALELWLAVEENKRKKPVIRKAFDTVVEYKGTAIILTLLLFCAGIVTNRYLAKMDESASIKTGNQIEKKLEPVNAKLEALAATSNRLEGTLSALAPFVSDLVHQEMERASKASPVAFEQDLPRIQNAFEAAKVERISTASDIQRSIGASLTKLIYTNADLPALSGAASSFASYRSDVIFGTNLAGTLPSCLTVKPAVYGKFPPPQPDKSDPSSGIISTLATPYVYRNCKIDLSELQKLFLIDEHMSLSDSPNGPIKQLIVAPIIFEHVLVRYRGEALPEVSLQFKECVFAFDLRQIPKEAGLSLLVAVMQDDPRDLTIRPTKVTG